MIDIIDLIIKWCVPVLCAGLVAFIKQQASYNKSMKLSMLSIIRSQITSKCEHYIKLGYMPEYARYCLEDLFKQYKALGGNHATEVLYNKALNLPLGLEDDK